jgi:N-acylneuraminate cytidylyltransferase
MSNLALIPARGGSKRIHKKNIKEFNSQPIISYSIKSAIESNLFDEIMVSTDDHEIAETAIRYGAQVPFFRSQKNSSDFSTTFEVIEEVLEKYNEIQIFFDNICCIYPCAPLIQINKLKLAYDLLIENNYNSVFPVIRYSNPIQRALKLVDDRVDMFYPEMKNIRSQDLENSYFDAGQFYWANTLKLLSQKSLYTNNTGAIILDELEAHDIDNEIDWLITEIKYSLLKNK